MKSEVGIRANVGKLFRNANLIVHQGIANIFHQDVKHLCILRVIEEIRKIVSGCD